nr:hypothetical protein [uncultured Pseudoxanthomonas sp.]
MTHADASRRDRVLVSTAIVKVATALIVLGLAACSREMPSQSIEQGCEPFRDLAWEDMSPNDRETLSNAASDFCAILAGAPPPHARRSPDFTPPPNSGTQLYLGRGYRITAVRNYRFVGGTPVGVVGPVLRLDAGIASPEPIEVSQVRLMGVPPTR